VVLPNPVPPRRFEAHLEVHAGSIDEDTDEQGLAHLVEHVTFLGSKKREGLLGTGSRSNAYTDFHHTVFHIHSPLEGPLGQPMLTLALEALEEIAFKPRFLPQRIEKERRAVLAELQMMNTIEYRVDCQLLEQLHSENPLGNRFPIGKQEQIVAWDHDKVRRYHAKHYFPANTTLYVVGDVDAGECERMIHEAYGATPERPHTTLAAGASEDMQVEVPEKDRRSAAPPVVHFWTSGGAGVGPAGVPEAGVGAAAAREDTAGALPALATGKCAAVRLRQGARGSRHLHRRAGQLAHGAHRPLGAAVPRERAVQLVRGPAAALFHHRAGPLG
jgi:hypothetical protein